MFVRPWFLILLFVPILFYFWHKKAGALNPWDKVIDKELQPFLLVSKGAAVIRRRVGTLGLLWTLLSVAAAGPYVSFDEVPGESRMPANVIVLDLSPVTDAARLNTSLVKMQELLNRLAAAGEQVGLVLSDTAGYVAVPVTPDVALVRQTALTVKPGLLPTPGTDPAAGVEKAAELLTQSDAADGRIFVITPGGFDVSDFVRRVRMLPYQIGILGIGEEGTGAPVAAPKGGFLKDASGRLITAGLDSKALEKAGVFVLKTPDMSDIRSLLAQTRSGTVNGGTKTDALVRMPHDLGPWFVLAALPLMAFLFRRGVFFLWLFVFMAVPAYADMFRRPDQIDYARMRQGYDLFQNGSYAESAALFETLPSDEALYNRATAAAHAGDLNGAIGLYGELLKKRPDHTDGAFNKAYLEKLLEQQNAPSESQSDDLADKAKQDGEKSSSKADSSQGNNQHNTADSKPTDQTEQSGDSQEQESISENHTATGVGDGQQEQNQAQPTADAEAAAAANERKSGFSESDTQVQKNDGETGEREGTADETAVNEQMTLPPDENESAADEAVSSSDEVQQPVYETAPESETNGQTADGFVHPESVDQETQQLFNRIRQDPSRVLRYRLYRQYQRQSAPRATYGG